MCSTYTIYATLTTLNLSILISHYYFTILPYEKQLNLLSHYIKYLRFYIVVYLTFFIVLKRKIQYFLYHIGIHSTKSTQYRSINFTLFKGLFHQCFIVLKNKERPQKPFFSILQFKIIRVDVFSNQNTQQPIYTRDCNNRQYRCS